MVNIAEKSELGRFTNQSMAHCVTLQVMHYLVGGKPCMQITTRQLPSEYPTCMMRATFSRAGASRDTRHAADDGRTICAIPYGVAA